MNGYWDRWGVWNVEDKQPVIDPDFLEAVEEKVARSTDVGGWQHGPVFIVEQAQDEQVDTPSWLTGLDEYPKPPGADALIKEIAADSAALHAKLERLKRLY